MRRMRMVIAGEMRDGAAAPALAQGFRQAGWVVEKVDHLRYLTHREDWLSRLADRATARYSAYAYNRGLFRAVERQQADVLLFVKGTLLTPTMLDRVRARGTLAVQFFPDVEFTHQGLHPQLSSHCDMVFTTKSFHLNYLEERLGSDRVRFVHHGFDPLIHRNLSPLEESEFDHDIIFIGNFSPYKRDYLAPLGKAGFERFAIFGHGWQAVSGAGLAHHINNQAPVGDLYTLALSRSRIAIALHHGPVRTPGWEDQVSTRSFEIPASGSMMMHIDNSEIRELFEADKEFVPFRSSTELVSRLQSYLRDPLARRAVARAGHLRALREHSYWARANAMSQEIIEEVAARGTPGFLPLSKQKA